MTVEEVVPGNPGESGPACLPLVTPQDGPRTTPGNSLFSYMHSDQSDAPFE